MNRWHYRLCLCVLGSCFGSASRGRTHASRGVILALVTPHAPRRNCTSDGTSRSVRKTSPAPRRCVNAPWFYQNACALWIQLRQNRTPPDNCSHHEPWSSYAVLPIFALANAGGLCLSMSWRRMGVCVGDYSDWLSASRSASCGGLARGSFAAPKSLGIRWRQLAGAGALAGIGFTMSLFMPSRRLPSPLFRAAKIAISRLPSSPGFGTMILGLKARRPSPWLRWAGSIHG